MKYQGFYDGKRNQAEVVYGEGSAATLPEKVKTSGEKALLITDKIINTQTGLVEKISGLLGSRLAGIFTETKPHTPRGAVLEAAEMARTLKSDCLISLGGGSTTDTAKAVKLALWMDISNEEGFDRARGKLSGLETRNGAESLPLHISLPTTLVGAEHTSGVGITNEATHGKQVFIHPMLQSQIVILDPLLTVFTPPLLWISTGVKALEHAIASLSAIERHPIVDATAALAVQTLSVELARSFTHPDDLASRGQLQLGAWLAQFASDATSASRMGLSHALGRQCGSVSGAPHGLISSVILPLSVDYNAKACGDGILMAARALGIITEGLTGEDIGHAVASAIRSLVTHLGLPMRLRDVGVSRDALPVIARRTMTDMSIGANPRPIASADEVLALLEQTW